MTWVSTSKKNSSFATLFFLYGIRKKETEKVSDIKTKDLLPII